MNTQFQGIYAVVVTPFHEDGTFDLADRTGRAGSLHPWSNR